LGKRREERINFTDEWLEMGFWMTSTNTPLKSGNTVLSPLPPGKGVEVRSFHVLLID